MNELYTLAIRTYRANGTIITTGIRDLTIDDLDGARSQARAAARHGESVELTVLAQG